MADEPKRVAVILAGPDHPIRRRGKSRFILALAALRGLEVAAPEVKRQPVIDRCWVDECSTIDIEKLEKR